VKKKSRREKKVFFSFFVQVYRKMLRAQIFALAAAMAASVISACSEYNNEYSCVNSYSQSCAWCSANCCVSGGTAGEACYCNGDGSGGTGMSAAAICGLVAGVIFWICVCVLLFRCCRQRYYTQPVVVTRTIIVQEQAPTTGYAHYGQPVVEGKVYDQTQYRTAGNI
jgi:hypothetical protein